MTAEDCEVAARSTDAGDYNKSWDVYHAAQWLFKEVVDNLDNKSRDKTNKKNFNACTRAIREWWNALPKERMAEAEAATKKWNSDRAIKEKQAM